MPISSGVKLELSIMTPNPIFAAFWGNYVNAKDAGETDRTTHLEVINLACYRKLEGRSEALLEHGRNFAGRVDLCPEG